MKSFCIKNNNEEILNYLLNKLEKMNMDNIYISKNKFKYYKNIIIHYKGDEEAIFVLKLSEILSECIIKFYEKNIVKRIINRDFFYFNDEEKKYIINNCDELLVINETDEYYMRKRKIQECLLEYILDNKFFILDGFVNFRIFEYTYLIEETVDVAVNKFIIDREYKEFVKLLQDFIFSQPNKTGTIHLIYNSSTPIMLDENKNIIVYNKEISYPKYLSDISFSSNDYCLNELLNLLPEKIILHLLAEEDEFCTTLKLIFKNRLFICKECNICNTFKLLTNSSEFKSYNLSLNN